MMAAAEDVVEGRHGASGGRRFMQPTFVHSQKRFLNSDQDTIRNAFASNNFNSLRKEIPSQILPDTISDLKGQRCVDLRESLQKRQEEREREKERGTLAPQQQSTEDVPEWEGGERDGTKQFQGYSTVKQPSTLTPVVVTALYNPHPKKKGSETAREGEKEKEKAGTLLEFRSFRDFHLWKDKYCKNVREWVFRFHAKPAFWRPGNGTVLPYEPIFGLHSELERSILAPLTEGDRETHTDSHAILSEDSSRILGGPQVPSTERASCRRAFRSLALHDPKSVRSFVVEDARRGSLTGTSAAAGLRESGAPGDFLVESSVMLPALPAVTPLPPHANADEHNLFNSHVPGPTREQDEAATQNWGLTTCGSLASAKNAKGHSTSRSIRFLSPVASAVSLHSAPPTGRSPERDRPPLTASASDAAFPSPSRSLTRSGQPPPSLPQANVTFRSSGSKWAHGSQQSATGLGGQSASDTHSQQPRPLGMSTGTDSRALLGRPTRQFDRNARPTGPPQTDTKALRHLSSHRYISPPRRSSLHGGELVDVAEGPVVAAETYCSHRQGGISVVAGSVPRGFEARRAALQATAHALSRRLRNDWPDALATVHATESGLIQWSWYLPTVESEKGMCAYMQVVDREAPEIASGKFRKMAEMWGRRVRLLPPPQRILEGLVGGKTDQGETGGAEEQSAGPFGMSSEGHTGGEAGEGDTEGLEGKEEGESEKPALWCIFLHAPPWVRCQPSDAFEVANFQDFCDRAAGLSPFARSLLSATDSLMGPPPPEAAHGGGQSGKGYTLPQRRPHPTAIAAASKFSIANVYRGALLSDRPGQKSRDVTRTEHERVLARYGTCVLRCREAKIRVLSSAVQQLQGVFGDRTRSRVDTTSGVRSEDVRGVGTETPKPSIDVLMDLVRKYETQKALERRQVEDNAEE
uniref:Uncharacterized protein n=1 Tax=Chromera velia CCMP2878 TaxID=1169474 RepID=A0A0G4H8L0_9ALVE|eukprot:Cvel_5873.t1-p1 / transcript=Cvel_5873.t1 / gene=Cvel_5873 / organism=Chromera_velia_CCMP2878 / gene_product=hypothetical protein / transcript_product=hypothetical protein / location=Cvel_scaffold279:75051-79763(+) / protein_length=921 / sequence_SO=supercontig / SO=protein_coding / is_pseudo=false